MIFTHTVLLESGEFGSVITTLKENELINRTVCAEIVINDLKVKKYGKVKKVITQLELEI